MCVASTRVSGIAVHEPPVTAFCCSVALATPLASTLIATDFLHALRLGTGMTFVTITQKRVERRPRLERTVKPERAMVPLAVTTLTVPARPEGFRATVTSLGVPVPSARANAAAV